MDGERKAASEANVKPPEFWTEANTVRWQREQWEGEGDQSEAQRGWALKYSYGDRVLRAGVACYRPFTAAEYNAARGNGPANPVFFDGTPQPYIRPLPGRKRVRRNVA